LLSSSLVQNAASPEDATFEPCSLQTAVAGVSDDRRLATVAAYWRLSRAVSDYRWSLHELKQLEELMPAKNSVEGPMLSTARAAADARTHEADVGVIRAEEALRRARGQNGAPSANIIPTDRPLVGAYRTYFDTLFANRTPPGRTHEINRLLPVRLDAISVRTAAVQSAASAARYADDAHAKGETDMRTVLACHDEWHRQRREFLDAVLDYNLDIAEYAAAAVPSDMPAEKFVAMLVRPKPAEGATSAPSLSGTGGTRPSYAADPNANFGRGASAAPAEPRSSDSRNSMVPRSLSADGWVPSGPRNAEVDDAPRGRPAESEPAASPLGQQADPFSKPSTPDRYGDRYGNYGR
jgi:hypothetical protein